MKNIIWHAFFYFTKRLDQETHPNSSCNECATAVRAVMPNFLENSPFIFSRKAKGICNKHSQSYWINFFSVHVIRKIDFVRSYTCRPNSSSATAKYVYPLSTTKLNVWRSQVNVKRESLSGNFCRHWIAIVEKFPDCQNKNSSSHPLLQRLGLPVIQCCTFEKQTYKCGVVTENRCSTRHKWIDERHRCLLRLCSLSTLYDPLCQTQLVD